MQILTGFLFDFYLAPAHLFYWQMNLTLPFWVCAAKAALLHADPYWPSFLYPLAICSVLVQHQVNYSPVNKCIETICLLVEGFFVLLLYKTASSYFLILALSQLSCGTFHGQLKFPSLLQKSSLLCRYSLLRMSICSSSRHWDAGECV